MLSIFALGTNPLDVLLRFYVSHEDEINTKQLTIGVNKT